jgi:ferrous iron transport protein B
MQAAHKLSPQEAGASQVLLVGAPNVGKSALFNALTGRYVVVSNYPGTTVEVSRGKTTLAERTFDITDTPGMYSLLPVSEEERVTQRLLLGVRDELVLQVLDAKTLERGLPLTAQLRALGARVVLALNMMDEAEERGLTIDAAALSEKVGVPVVPVVAISGRGVELLRTTLAEVAERPVPPPAAEGLFPQTLAFAVEAVASELSGVSPARAQVMATLLLQADAELSATAPSAARARAESLRAELSERQEDPAFTVARHQHALARAWVDGSVRRQGTRGRTLADRIGALLAHPLTGIPALLLVLYFGLYQFVGVFGAGVVVDLLESELFGAYLNPWFDATMNGLLPGEGGWQYWLRELFAGDYGLVTLGLTYAVAIVLPIVSLFFLFFSALEDSGYFPRLALLVDRVFKRIGLNGRAVIPVVLGFACDTMATMVTRVQETRRERVITTFLLALAVPCSAQYGVMAGILAATAAGGGFGGMSGIFMVWAGLVALVFLVAGRVASKLVKGEAASFYMELPPVRLPRLGNVLVKTFARMKWYFAEIFPLFLLASFLIWVGRLTGLFDLLIRALVPVVGALGLPPAAAEIFLFGFFRRDFGAAGLYDLTQQGALSSGQILVAAVTLTLFMPCVAQVLVMVRERGLRTTAVICAAVVGIAFAVGLAVRWMLPAVGVAL